MECEKDCGTCWRLDCPHCEDVTEEVDMDLDTDIYGAIQLSESHR